MNIITKRKQEQDQLTENLKKLLVKSSSRKIAWIRRRLVQSHFYLEIIRYDFKYQNLLYI